jgi:hypothetical protein
MGRGRAKAKQTKVARALKYGGPQTDLERLQKELQGGVHGDPMPSLEAVEDDEDADDEFTDDLYAKYADEDDED